MLYNALYASLALLGGFRRPGERLARAFLTCRGNFHEVAVKGAVHPVRRDVELALGGLNEAVTAGRDLKRSTRIRARGAARA